MTENKTELEKVLQEYNEALSWSTADLEAVPYKTRAGVEGRKRASLAALPGITAKYAEALKNHAFVVAVSGPGTADYAKLVAEEADSVVVSANSLYWRLADVVLPSIGASGTFGAHALSLMFGELRTIAQELGITQVPAPVLRETPAIRSRDEALRLVRNLLESANGTELQERYLRKEIVEMCLEAGASKGTVLVLVTDLDKPALVRAAVKQGRTLEVQAPQEVTKKFVMETFADIKKQLKSLKNQDKE